MPAIAERLAAFEHFSRRETVTPPPAQGKMLYEMIGVVCAIAEGEGLIADVRRYGLAAFPKSKSKQFLMVYNRHTVRSTDI